MHGRPFGRDRLTPYLRQLPLNQLGFQEVETSRKDCENPWRAVAMLSPPATSKRSPPQDICSIREGALRVVWWKCKVRSWRAKRTSSGLDFGHTMVVHNVNK